MGDSGAKPEFDFDPLRCRSAACPPRPDPAHANPVRQDLGLASRWRAAPTDATSSTSTGTCSTSCTPPMPSRSSPRRSRGVRRPDLTFSMQDHTVADQARPRRHHEPRQARRSCGRCARAAAATASACSTSTIPSRASPMSSRRSSAWCCRARPTRCPTAMPAPSAVSARSPSAVGTTELEHVLATQVLATRSGRSACACALDGRLGRSGRRQGRGAAHHRRDRRRRRPRPRGRICRRGGAGDGDREPADAVQSRHRDGRAQRLRRARRHHVLLDRGPSLGAAGRAVGRALAAWRTLASDRRRAVRSRHRRSTAATLEPQITWGTDPSQAIAVTGRVPDPAAPRPDRRAAMQRALDYMGLTPGTPIAGLPVDRVFIGSCTNARLPDLAPPRRWRADAASPRASSPWWCRARPR